MAKRKRSSDSSSDDEEEDWRESSKGRSKPKPKPKKPIKEEEKEEGEVEDEDEDEDYEEFNDGYDENLIGDEEDQMRLANMNEKERELELFNRSEKREVLKTRFEIEKKLRMAKKKEMLQSQTKIRSNERRRTIEEKRKVKNAIKGLKEQREKRKQKQQRLRAIDIYSSSSSDGEDDSDKKRGKRSSSSSSSSSSSNDDSGDEKNRKDDDEGEGAGSDDDEKEKEDFVLTVEDLNLIRVSRFRASQWCHAPFFKDTVVGCFARIFIGMRRKATNPVEQTPVYRACQIMNVMEGPRTYELEKTRTNKIIAVKHGSDTRNFKFDIVSNSPFIQSEFEELKARCERDKVELPNKDQITRKQADIDNAINYNYKDSDIEAIVREKEKYKQNPTNFAVRKTELLKQKEMAEQLNSVEEVERISQEIEELESKAKELDLKRTKSISAISYINERNRMRNIIESEKAIMEAREKEKEQGDDPFRRRKCAPMLVHKFVKNSPGTSAGEKDPKRETENSTGKDGPDAQVSKTSSACKVKSHPDDSAASSSPKHNESINNDLFSAHNFDIQIDFDIGPGLNMTSTSSSFSASTYSPQFHSLNTSLSKTPTTNRRSLNLEEYKKKKGLI